MNLGFCLAFQDDRDAETSCYTACKNTQSYIETFFDVLDLNQVQSQDTTNNL